MFASRPGHRSEASFMLLALPTITWLCWKGQAGTNALAYYRQSETTATKSYITLGPGPTIEDNCQKIYNGLRCIFIFKLFSFWPIIGSKSPGSNKIRNSKFEIWSHVGKNFLSRFQLFVRAGNTNWRGSLSTVDLLIKIACLVTQVNSIYNKKAADLN